MKSPQTTRKIEEKTPSPNPQSTNPSTSIWFSKRFLVCSMMFACYLMTAVTRFNISIALVDMTSAKTNEIGNLTQIQLAEFDWDSKTVGFILSISYYGGLSACVGGYVVSKLGGATGCTISLLFIGITTMLNPISLYYGFYVFLACRVLTGICESFLLVSILEVCSKWIPQNERSKLISFTITGFNMGVAIVHGLCAFLANGWGWPMIFYVTGALAIITSIICFTLVNNQPSEDKWISEEELAYIQQGTAAYQKKQVAHPYRSISTSAPVWAFIAARFCWMWLLTIIITCLPLYVKDVTHQDINKVGIISSVPNAVCIFTITISGILLEYGKKKDISVSQLHKILISGSFLMSSVLFLSSAYFSNLIVSLISFVLTQILMPIVSLVTQIINISIAPNSNSVISGLGTFAMSVSSILARSITGLMLEHRSVEEWNNCFILTSGVSLLGAIIFVIYGSSEAQPWSVPTTDTSKQKGPNSCNENRC
ncbi:vesicular glutamate transporter 2-like isoform X2 [Planococcus citri]|uniref:vesicular glutamate transporter 2-like isoform X2 n=1 Tax=Planococcus citri TaxID=170843 RepID=UPI0031F8DC69